MIKPFLAYVITRTAVFTILIYTFGKSERPLPQPKSTYSECEKTSLTAVIGLQDTLRRNPHLGCNYMLGTQAIGELMLEYRDWSIIYKLLLCGVIIVQLYIIQFNSDIRLFKLRKINPLQVQQKLSYNNSQKQSCGRQTDSTRKTSLPSISVPEDNQSKRTGITRQRSYTVSLPVQHNDMKMLDNNMTSVRKPLRVDINATKLLGRFRLFNFKTSDSFSPIFFSPIFITVHSFKYE